MAVYSLQPCKLFRAMLCVYTTNDNVYTLVTCISICKLSYFHWPHVIWERSKLYRGTADVYTLGTHILYIRLARSRLQCPYFTCWETMIRYINYNLHDKYINNHHLFPYSAYCLYNNNHCLYTIYISYVGSTKYNIFIRCVGIFLMIFL